MSRHDGMTEERSPLVRALLEAAARETVPAESRVRVAQGLGLAAAGCSPSITSLQAPPGHARASWAKLALLGVVGGLCIGGSSSLRVDVGRDTPSTVALEAPAPMQELPVREAVRKEAALPSAVRVSALESAEPRSSEPPRARPSSALRPSQRAHTPSSKPVAAAVAAAPARAEARTARGLIDEVRQLDGVRARLREQRAGVALEALDAYARAFPRGELALEAAVLKVQALFDAGHAREAQSLARATLARPGSERYESELRARLEKHE